MTSLKEHLNNSWDSKIAEILYNNITVHLIPSLPWKQNKIKVKSINSNPVTWCKYKKDLSQGFHISRHLSTADKYYVNDLVYAVLAERCKELYRKNGVSLKITTFLTAQERAKEKAKERTKIKSIEIKRKTSLEFGPRAQRDIAKSILFHFINDKIGPLLQLDLTYPTWQFTTLFCETFGDELPYTFKAIDSSLLEIDKTGESLLRELRKLTSGNEQEFIKKHLLMSEDSNVRRFAVAFVDTSSIAMGLLDSTDKVRYAAERLLQVGV